MAGPDSKTPDWDARSYHRVSNPQFTWGLKVLERLSLEGSETVMDAGCGTGRLTGKLLERLPRGRVIALDASAAMLEEARGLLAPRFGVQVDFVQADLGALGGSLAMAEVAEVVFSTATFHWVKEHDALFAGLHRALRPGGRLCAQCGGGANLHTLHERAAAGMAEPDFAPHFAGWTDPWYFAEQAITAERLTRAGFGDVRVWLEEAPTRFEDAEAYAVFLRTVVLRHHLARLPDETLKERYLAGIVEAAGRDPSPYTLDYWRLNLEATKPG
jgi:trans-aconitate methyltransferase